MLNLNVMLMTCVVNEDVYNHRWQLHALTSYRHGNQNVIEWTIMDCTGVDWNLTITTDKKLSKKTEIKTQ